MCVPLREAPTRAFARACLWREHLAPQAVRAGQARRLHAGGEAEVGDLDAVLAVQQHVWRLEVAVHHSVGVQEGEAGGDARGDAEEEAARRRPLQRLLQVAAVAVLEDDAAREPLLHRAEEPDHVGVAWLRKPRQHADLDVPAREGVPPPAENLGRHHLPAPLGEVGGAAQAAPQPAAEDEVVEGGASHMRLGARKGASARARGVARRRLRRRRLLPRRKRRRGRCGKRAVRRRLRSAEPQQEELLDLFARDAAQRVAEAAHSLDWAAGPAKQRQGDAGQVRSGSSVLRLPRPCADCGTHTAATDLVATILVFAALTASFAALAAAAALALALAATSVLAATTTSASSCAAVAALAQCSSSSAAVASALAAAAYAAAALAAAADVAALAASTLADALAAVTSALSAGSAAFGSTTRPAQPAAALAPAVGLHLELPAGRCGRGRRLPGTLLWLVPGPAGQCAALLRATLRSRACRQCRLRAARCDRDARSLPRSRRCRLRQRGAGARAREATVGPRPERDRSLTLLRRQRHPRRRQRRRRGRLGATRDRVGV